MPLAHPPRRAAMVLALSAAACSRPRVQTETGYGYLQLPQPDRVLVYRLATTPDAVQLDQGVAARLQRATGDVSPQQQAQEVLDQVNNAIVRTLVAQLQSYGLPAVAADGSVPSVGTALIVQGQLVSVNEGNRTRRTLIGLGAGRSTVTADAQLYFSADGTAPRFLQALDASDDSGHMPGMAETMGASAVAGGSVAVATGAGAGLHTVGETQHNSATDDATRLAKGLAQQIGQFCIRQSWLPAGAVR